MLQQFCLSGPQLAAHGITVPVALPPMTQAQRDILERLLPLLEGSEMAVFDTMGELLAQGDSPRWALLDGAVQGMDFGQAADWVRQALSG